MHNEWSHEQVVTERYFLFKGVNGARKNEFESRFTCLQPHF